jgi:hypothetical protein
MWRHELNHPLDPDRQLAHWIWRTRSEWFEKLARRFLAHGIVSHSRRNLAIMADLAMATSRHYR